MNKKKLLNHILVFGRNIIEIGFIKAIKYTFNRLIFGRFASITPI